DPGAATGFVPLPVVPGHAGELGGGEEGYGGHALAFPRMTAAAHTSRSLLDRPSGASARMSGRTPPLSTKSRMTLLAVTRSIPPLMPATASSVLTFLDEFSSLVSLLFLLVLLGGSVGVPLSVKICTPFGSLTVPLSGSLTV